MYEPCTNDDDSDDIDDDCDDIDDDCYVIDDDCDDIDGDCDDDIDSDNKFAYIFVINHLFLLIYIFYS